MKKNIKIVIIKLILLILIILILGKYSYNYYINNEHVTKEELENIKIDEYNFEQLEKVKSVLNGLNKNSYSFENLKEFNEKFNQNIKPIKNCYLLSNGNNVFLDKSNDNYIFMFKLYSMDYGKRYKNMYYIYPEYKFQEIENSLCSSHGGICGTDVAFGDYLETISTPCED
ncbi:MAG: hypothetical protein PHH98_04145 [Candidatus Gracilibacteria bacterium]|nr:hypothetical protein [Candidatus Gracilibacteria bacterium]